MNILPPTFKAHRTGPKGQQCSVKSSSAKAFCPSVQCLTVHYCSSRVSARATYFESQRNIFASASGIARGEIRVVSASARKGRRRRRDASSGTTPSKRNDDINRPIRERLIVGPLFRLFGGELFADGRLADRPMARRDSSGPQLM